ncbi:MAG TPA: HipA N-terminal domain-containing protein, partial [Phenylobacterium sp.]
MPESLDVLLYGRKIGQIIDLGGDRNLFVFADEYLGDPTRPMLSLGFKGAQGGVAYQPRPRQTQVDPFFSNLLPEGKLRAYVAERDQVHPGREFQLLRRLGGDLPGAVEVRLADGESSDAELPGALAQPANSGPLKFSLAGVQMK